MTSRDERIFEDPASGNASGTLVGIGGGLDIVDLEVRREPEFRSLEQGKVSPSLYGDNKRAGLVGLEIVAGKTGRNPVLTHSASEIGRRTGRQIPDIDRDSL